MRSAIRAIGWPSPAAAILFLSYVTLTVQSRFADSEISVAIGKSAFLQPDDLNIEPVENMTSCKVKAVTDDVANVLRVGRIEPQVFDCSFKRDSVRYIHSGNPLLTSDRVVLRVYQFRDETVMENQVEINVAIGQPDYEVFVNQPRQRYIGVDDSSPFSEPIDENFLRFRYDFTSGGASCLISYADPNLVQQFPLGGRLVYGSVNQTTVDNLTIECRDFLRKDIRYRRQSETSRVETDYIPLSVEVEDAGSSGGTIRERLYLEVHDVDARSNSPPLVVVNDSVVLRVQQLQFLTLTADALSAVDRETPDHQLIFNITRMSAAPRNQSRLVQSDLGEENVGHFVNIQDHTRALTSFRQDDVISKRIAFYPASAALLVEGIDVTVELVAIDSQFAVSDVVKMIIHVVPSQSAVKVGYGRGIVVPEGGKQQITTRNLVLYGGNRQSITFHVRGGLRHGGLEVGGLKATTFTGNDLERNAVVYRHDGSDATDDRIVLRVASNGGGITGGRHAAKIRLPVIVLPVDDNAPHLTSNEPLEVMRGGYGLITAKSLNASDRDLANRKKIVYLLRSQPKAGEVIKRFSSLTSGRPTLRFTQMDIDRGFIYYRHHGGGGGNSATAETEGMKETDQIEFRLTDDSDTPNKSGRYNLEVVVVPSDNLPPHELVPGSMSSSQTPSEPRRATIYETNTAVLGREQLCYEDVENRTDNVIYTITNQPYFVTSSITVDAGRLLLVPSGSYPTAGSRESVARLGVPATTFSQLDVDDGRLVYLPPRDDIGPVERLVRFVFAVTDSRGSSIIDQLFDITILPVNNQIPSLSTTDVDDSGVIIVSEGGSVRLDSDVVAVNDPDTDVDKLIVTVETLPVSGQLAKNHVRLNVGEYFSGVDFNISDIRYTHSGQKTTQDAFSLSVFDGRHKVTKDFSVSVQQPVNNTGTVQPAFTDDTTSRLEVDEGGEAVLSVSHLAATGGPPGTEHQLMFHVLKSPEFGELHLDASNVAIPPVQPSSDASQVVQTTPIYRFNQSDLARGAVRYVHTGGEIGREPVTDVFTVTVTEADKPLRMHPSSPVPLRDIEVTVLPRDNAAPQLVVGGPVRITGNRPAVIAPEVITARDVDSPDDALMFIVVQTPMWGFLERSKAATRSGRSQTSRRISTFTLADLHEGTIQYVPSNLARAGGPPSDSFSVYVTDGKNRSPQAQIDVSVQPVSVRLPEFRVVESLSVDEGGERMFEVQLADRVLSRVVLGASDAEQTGPLVLSAVVPPGHGKLVLTGRSERDGSTYQTDLRELTLTQPTVQLIYRHDGTESREDGFTLSLSDGSSSYRKSVTVSVRAVNDERPQLVKNIPASVDFGGTITITSGYLKATDVDNFPDEIFFVLSGKPKRGDLEILRGGVGTTGSLERFHHQLQRDQPALSIGGSSESGLVSSVSGTWETLETGNNFTQQAVDEKRIRYVHTMCLGDSAQQPGDEFTFVVTDGALSLPPSTFVIDISRANARRLLVHSRDMVIRDGETRVVSVDLLNADDGSNRPYELTFAVTNQPQHGVLGLAGQANSPLTSFTQADLKAQRILYKHSGGGSFSGRTGNSGGLSKDGFRFTVTSLSRPYLTPVNGQFRVVIESLDRQLPTLDSNVPLTVVEGDTATLTSSNLRVSQPGTPSANLTFIVVERPHRGELLVGGVPVARSFTQSDIDSGAVDYRSDTVDDTMTDYFLFAVADGRHDGYLVNGTAHRKPAFFNVLIQPASKEPPRLIRNRPPENIRNLGSGRQGLVIGSGQLEAIRAQPGGKPADLWYVLKENCCQLGHLEHLKTGRPIKRKFSQKDIDDGNVVYVLNSVDQRRSGGSSALTQTNDSFVFRLQDQHHNFLDNQRYVLEWSVVTIEKPQYTVCENARRLDVVIRRQGAINGRVTANVRAKPLSARQGADFLVGSDSLVVFQPGVTRVTWTVSVVQDDLENEPDEKFKILLRSPTNALVGDVNKAVVHLLNAVNGECSASVNVQSPKRRPDEVDNNYDDEFEGFDEDYEDRQKLLDTFGEDAEEDDNDDVFGESDVLDADDEDDFNEDDFDGFGQNRRDPDLLPPPRDDTAAAAPVGGLLGDQWDDRTSWQAGVGSDGRRTGSRREQLQKKSKKSRKNNDVRKATTGNDRRQNVAERNGSKRQRERVRAALTTTTAKPLNAFVPQDCTADTNGLLYFDMLSSKMYRCDGRGWQEWGWGSGGPVSDGVGGGGHGDGLQYSSLLKDAAAAPAAPRQRASDDEDDLERNEDEDDEDAQILARVMEDNERIETSTVRSVVAGDGGGKRVKNACQLGWTAYENGCYRVHVDKMSWIDAQRTCRNEGGQLTDVRSKAHLMWLSKQLAGSKNFWIGLSDRTQPGVWQFDNSRRPVDFFNWRRGFPRRPSADDPTRGRGQGSQPRDACVQVDKRGEWVNRPCSPKPRAKFVCAVYPQQQQQQQQSASSSSRRRTGRQQQRG